jgi:hypothetical protein
MVAPRLADSHVKLEFLVRELDLKTNAPSVNDGPPER